MRGNLNVPFSGKGALSTVLPLPDHPAAVTDGQETVIVTCRALRSNQQCAAKRLSEIRARQDRKKSGSRSWRRLQRRQSRFLAKRRRAWEMEHKASRAVVQWAKARGVATLVIGDVRDVADGKRLTKKSQQKIGVWSHGRQRDYISYKSEAAGITVTLVEEAYTSQTCPKCLNCTKPRGRVSRCAVCGFVGYRDGVGCANLLSQHYPGEPGHVWPTAPTYRYPFGVLRSRLDTAYVASEPTTQQG